MQCCTLKKLRWFIRLRNNELYRLTYILRIWNLLKFGGKIRQINHANSSGKSRLQKNPPNRILSVRCTYTTFLLFYLQPCCLLYGCHAIFFGFLFLQTIVLSRASLSFSKSEDKIRKVKRRLVIPWGCWYWRSVLSSGSSLTLNRCFSSWGHNLKIHFKYILSF